MAMIAALLVVAAIAVQLAWLGAAASLLSVGLAATWLVWQRGRWHWTPALRSRAAVAIAVFALHVAEETRAGMAAALPALIGRPPWTDLRFVVFNAAWMIVFLFAAVTARPGHRLPLLPLLFLAIIGGIANGIVHLLLVLEQGGYFPGAWTAPLALAAGVALLKAMRAEPAPFAVP